MKQYISQNSLAKLVGVSAPTVAKRLQKAGAVPDGVAVNGRRHSLLFRFERLPRLRQILAASLLTCAVVGCMAQTNINMMTLTVTIPEQPFRHYVGDVFEETVYAGPFDMMIGGSYTLSIQNGGATTYIFDRVTAGETNHVYGSISVPWQLGLSLEPVPVASISLSGSYHDIPTDTVVPFGVGPSILYATPGSSGFDFEVLFGASPQVGVIFNESVLPNLSLSGANQDVIPHGPFGGVIIVPKYNQKPYDPMSHDMVGHVGTNRTYHVEVSSDGSTWSADGTVTSDANGAFITSRTNDADAVFYRITDGNP